ncbi:MAG TPA: dihydrofolate reductase family protein [Planctomycetota bacterium]|nr:dihydrofolate reductase family protein [Planctomycetota bacterium]
MRKLILWNVVTLDGLFEGTRSWDLPWHERIWGEELEAFSLEQLRSADLLLFGRVTYEGMAAYWRTAEGEIASHMNRLPKVVFSRTLRSVDWSNSTLAKGDAAAEVSRLKGEGDGDMFVFGSATLSARLMDASLFDEIRLAIAPVLAGSGRHLFPPGQKRRNLRLLESRPLSTGAVLLRYLPERVD